MYFSDAGMKSLENVDIKYLPWSSHLVKRENFVKNGLKYWRFLKPYYKWTTTKKRCFLRNTSDQTFNVNNQTKT